ncbi:MAG TPA: ASPIC/UnbV domain-containing protein, partial [Fredinandcohnia sp.]|nr:ASPIC/UnbV domain-containing protein [Fredinandcohnia sp.]
HSQIRCEDQCYERATVRFFENVLGDRGNWIQLDLRGGEGSNRMAIGARVEVETRGGKQVQQVGGGYGHYGIQHEHALHFGLGEARTAKVTIHWPDRARSTTRFTAQAGYRYRVEQGMPPKALR